VSNINGCNEIISDYENGLIVPPKDFESLSNAMLRIYEDKDLYQRLKSNARNKIKSRFEQRDFHNLLLQEYFNLK
jgi:glycosyltransferase involved in cell wall biosynthesis